MNKTSKIATILLIIGLLGVSTASAAPYRVDLGGTGTSTLPSGQLLMGNGKNPVTGTSSPTVSSITLTDGSATSTFAGNVKVTGNLQVNGNFFAPVSLVSSGNATINGILTVTGVSRFADGAVGTPSLSFTSDPNTGIYSGGADILRFVTGGSDRMTVLANGNVGIGTTTPNNKLDIYDTSKAAIGFSGAAGSAYKWTIGEDMNDSGRFKISSSSALGTNDRFAIDADGRTTIFGASNITLNPVNGAIYAIGGLVNMNSSNNARTRSTDNGVVIDRNVADANPALIVQQLNSGSTGDILQLKNSAATVLTVQQGGNVGIGTTSPFAKLSVVSTAGGSTPLFAVASSTNGAGTTTAFYIDERGRVAIGSMTNGNTALFTTRADTGVNTIIGSLSGDYGKLDWSSVLGGSFVVSALAGKTLSLGANNHYGTGADMVISTTGNVGIGTTTPNALLHVYGGNVQISNPGSVGGPVLTLDNYIGQQDATSTIKFGLGGSSATNLTINAQIQAKRTNVTYSGDTDLIYSNTFNGNLIERMRISSNGNVGIGTTSPFADLSVQSLGGTNPLLMVASSTNGTGTTTAMIVDYLGRTGINGGIPSLGYPLIVGSGNDSSYYYIGIKGTATDEYFGQSPAIATQFGISTIKQAFFANGASPLLIGTIPAQPLVLGTNNQERIRIDSSGNVGIGTTNPSQKLEVNGGIRQNTVTAKPTCDSTVRGTTWFFQGGAGVKDTYEVCAKDAADAYAWRTLY